MSIDTITFSNRSELLAYEVGVWFSEAPVETDHKSLVLTVTCPYGAELREHQYVPIVFAPDCDLGDRILASRIAFATGMEAVAFTSAVSFFGGCMNVSLLGKYVVVKENRPDDETDEKIEYEFGTLRALIARHRANRRPEL